MKYNKINIPLIKLIYASNFYCFKNINTNEFKLIFQLMKINYHEEHVQFSRHFQGYFQNILSLFKNLTTFNIFNVS